MISRAAMHRLVPLAAAGAVLVCAVLPASAHDGQDERPGAVQLDLEVLVTPAITGETTSGGRDPSVAVDALGNVLATALKENAQPATADGRAPAHVRAESWRWSSGDNGQTYINVSGRPAQSDSLVPGGSSVAAAADDRGRGYLLESYGGVGYVAVTRSTEKDDVRVEAIEPLTDAGILGGARLAAHGDGHVFLIGADPLGYHLRRSDNAGASFDAIPGTAFNNARSCDVAAGHGRAAKVVALACVTADGTAVAYISTDDFGTFRRSVLAPASTLTRERPAVAVANDGIVSVVVTTTASDRSSMLLRRSGDGRRWSSQEVASEPGRWSGVSLAVNKRGRLALAAYQLAPARGAQQAGRGWHVQLAVFDAGRVPVYVDFASHDPVAPAEWETGPDAGTAVTAAPDGRFQLLWTAVKVAAPVGSTSLLRNVWSVRTLST